MRERGHHISIQRANCIYHPGENFVCTKQFGPLSEEEAEVKASVLRDILPETGEGINVVRVQSEEEIPQMCLDCKFRR